MKVSGAYESLVRGVSQQVPQNRASGQCTEQVNLLPDPVRGLSRRPGSRRMGELAFGHHLPELIPGPYTDDTNSRRTFEYSSQGVDYVLLYRSAPNVPGSNLGVLGVYDKTNHQWLPVATDPLDTGVEALHDGGISAITAVGKYVFMAGWNLPAQATTVNKWTDAGNIGKAVAWVRGGAYSRTFEIRATRTNDTVVTFNYTTPPSSYPGTLTTADIQFSDPEYAKKVNDRVNAYNSAVTEWIGVAAAAIQPQNIAEQLRVEAVAAGLTVTRNGSALVFSDVKALTVKDGGDGTLLRGVAQEVESADKLSNLHYVGKIVRVRASDSAESYYLQAIPTDPNVTSGVTEVMWTEGVGEETTITQMLCYATVVGGTMYIASSAAILNTLTPGDHPAYIPSKSGDIDSNPVPFFVGGIITYLGMFQDRLLVGCGAVIRASKVGDYLNFFRTTVLTVPDDDPMEMQAQGTSDDTLRHSVLYDRDLVIFGDKRQYAINGRQALVPTGANLQVLASHAGTADCPPLAAGGLIFYAKRGEGRSGAYEMKPGPLTESPEAFEVSTQLDDYLSGDVIEMALSAKPTMLFLRTTGQRQSLHCFTYLDQADGRRQDAWHRWDFCPDLGILVGMATSSEGLLLFFIRKDHEDIVWVVCDRIPLTAGLDSLPYLDSQRPIADVTAGTGSIKETSDLATIKAAYGEGSNAFLFGAPLTELADLTAEFPSGTNLSVGYEMRSSFIPTNPFVKDRQDKAITTGRTVITRLVVSYAETSAVDVTLTAGEQSQTYEVDARVVGNLATMIGRVPVADGQLVQGIGKETREYTVELASRDWLPMTLTNIEWIGQLYHRAQRIG